MEAAPRQMTDLCRAASYHEQGCLQESPACPTDTHSCGEQMRPNYSPSGHFNGLHIPQSLSDTPSPLMRLVPVVCRKPCSSNKGGGAHKDKVVGRLVVTLQRLPDRNKGDD